MRTSDSRTCAPAVATARSISAGSSRDERVQRRRGRRRPVPPAGSRPPSLVHEQDRDVVAHRVGQPAGGRGADQLAGLLVGTQASRGRPGRPGSPAAGGRAARPQFSFTSLLSGRAPSASPPRTVASTSSRTRRMVSSSAASTFSRSSGSVLDGPQVEPPVGRRDRQPVQLVDLDARPALVLRTHGSGRGRLVADHAVDLAGGDVPLVRRRELGQRLALLAQRGEDVQRGQHAGVGAPEVAEVVVGRVLTAEDGVGALPSRP